VVELNRANYLMDLWLAGSHNHGADVVDFYERVASAAPGSYGVPYVHDGEMSVGDRDKWQV
jgi:hypothetical protein